MTSLTLGRTTALSEMDVQFFNDLYRGYAAEHIVGSELSRFGFEIFRVPADFGIDIVITNQFRVARGLKDDQRSFPFGFQVKGRWLKPKEVTEGTNGRPEATVDFSLKSHELEILIQQGTTGVVCVSFWPGSNGKLNPRLFWLDSVNLEQLKSRGFLRSVGNKFFLTVRYRLFPRTKKADFLEEIRNEFPENSKLIEKLQKELPNSFLRNWNASDYMQFARNDRRPNVDSLVFKSVWNVPTDFSTFPKHLDIVGLD